MKEFRKFAEEVTEEAGAALPAKRAKLEIITYKDAQDILTNLDLESEKFIIEAIGKKYPTHSILSEEKGEIKGDSEYRWIIDPLDGTKTYVRRLPFYGVTMALEYKGEVVVSAMYFPELKSLFSAAKESGSSINGERLKVSDKQELVDTLIYAYIPNPHRNAEKYDVAWEKLKKLGKEVYRLRGIEAVNLAFCWLALGACEAYVNLSNPPLIHDFAPGVLVAREAGAVIKRENDTIIAANNQEIYNQIMEVINGK